MDNKPINEMTDEEFAALSPKPRTVRLVVPHRQGYPGTVLTHSELIEGMAIRGYALTMEMFIPDSAMLTGAPERLLTFTLAAKAK